MKVLKIALLLVATFQLPGCVMAVGLAANAMGAKPTYFVPSDASKPGVVGVDPVATKGQSEAAMLLATHQTAPHTPVTPATATMHAPLTQTGYNATTSRRRELLVRATDITPAIASSANLSPPRGAVVLAVNPSGTAWAGGIRDGDIILSFNGQPINGVNDMQRSLSGIIPNTTVAATVWRGGAERPIAIQF